MWLVGANMRRASGKAGFPAGSSGASPFRLLDVNTFSDKDTVKYS